MPATSPTLRWQPWQWSGLLGPTYASPGTARAMMGYMGTHAMLMVTCNMQDTTVCRRSLCQSLFHSIRPRSAKDGAKLWKG